MDWQRTNNDCASGDIPRIPAFHPKLVFCIDFLSDVSPNSAGSNSIWSSSHRDFDRARFVEERKVLKGQ